MPVLRGYCCRYKGLGASLCGIVPYASVDLGVYFSLKEYLASMEGAGDPGVGTLCDPDADKCRNRSKTHVELRAGTCHLLGWRVALRRQHVECWSLIRCSSLGHGFKRLDWQCVALASSVTTVFITTSARDTEKERRECVGVGVGVGGGGGEGEGREHPCPYSICFVLWRLTFTWVVCTLPRSQGMPKYTGIWDCMRRTVQQDGVLGLCVGPASLHSA